MKAGKYRDLFKTIDTDKAMDDKIKNKLLYYQGAEDVQSVKKQSKAVFRRGKPIYFAFNNFSFLQQVLPSIAFLVFFVALIVSIRANLLGKNVASDTDTYVSSGSPAASNDSLAEGSETMTSSTVTTGTDLETLSDIIDTITADEAKTEEPSLVYQDSSLDNVASDVPDEAAPAVSAESPAEGVEDTMGSEVNTVTNAEGFSDQAQEGDFDSAWFDVTNENNMKVAIPNLIMRFHGTIATIDPNDFTDIALTRDGVPIDNSITMTNLIDQKEWHYENITDFYFAFAYENRDPGNYGLTGKYKGIPFTVYNKILEASVTDEPANPADIFSAGFCGYTDKDENYISISELCFYFKGRQNSFYPSDLTDLVITCNGEAVAFSYLDTAVRYYEVNSDNTETSYNLILREPLTASGDYIMKGNYKGIPISSCIINIP